ncbi:uncharacterized protein ARMOST_12599 [Armillaria ostoyae]|uniref:Uncharacterized protein n=1 Tax=Armillaria ostoyae TaxID=47428 RepID=A0A284RKE7_ARMOS|nr:uncharacterized protein ARMOST_12599 [Armillaria ostoyae]
MPVTVPKPMAGNAGLRDCEHASMRFGMPAAVSKPMTTRERGSQGSASNPAHALKPNRDSWPDARAYDCYGTQASGDREEGER